MLLCELSIYFQLPGSMTVQLFNSIFFFFPHNSLSFFSRFITQNTETLVMIRQPASSFYEAQKGEFILKAEELVETLPNPHKGLCTRNGRIYL